MFYFTHFCRPYESLPKPNCLEILAKDYLKGNILPKCGHLFPDDWWYHGEFVDLELTHCIPEAFICFMNHL